MATKQKSLLLLEKQGSFAVRETDIQVHPGFRLVLLANRPGYRKSDDVIMFVL